MEIKFADNIATNLIDVLRPSFPTANEIRFGVAFAKYSGLFLIEDDIRECLKNGGKVEFLVGLDFRTTEPKALRTILEMAKSGLDTKLFCFSDPSFKDTPVYHPKIYLVRKGDKSVISVGSSNLTRGGLKDNVEVNAIIEANIDEEVVSDIYGIYNALKFQKGRFEPDLAYIKNYEEAYEIVRKKHAEALKETSTRNRIKELKEREKHLPRPKPTGTELFGWQRLVYERLPEEFFRTNCMYAYEKEFQRVYPENKHIRDKIRQILQQLRELGLLKHIGKNRWLKA